MKTTKITTFLKKNWLNIILLGFILLMLFNPDAKVWVLQQIGKTGIFNTSLSVQKSDPTQPSLSYAFTNQEGEIITNELNKGKVVLINYWASWCSPCRAEMPSLQKLYSQFQSNNSFVFIFVSEDADSETAVNYVRENGFDLPVFFNTTGYSNQLVTSTLPTTYILNKEGQIVFHKTGIGNYSSKKFIDQLETLAGE